MSKTGTCGFVGYTARAREYWNAQAMAVAIKDADDSTAKHRFGECPGCKVGMNAESDYVMIVGANHSSLGPIIRCINCYDVMIMRGV